MQGSKFAPSNVQEYGSKDLNANYQGKQFLALKNTTTNMDFKVTDDCLVDGGRFIADGINVMFGDKITAQVVDVDNILGYGAGVVLNQFISNWYLAPGNNVQWDFSMPYPAKIFAGLYLRIAYTSVGTTNDINIAINYKLHKVLW